MIIVSLTKLFETDPQAVLEERLHVYTNVLLDLFYLVVVFCSELVFVNLSCAVEIRWNWLTNLFEVIHRCLFDFAEHTEASLLACKLIPKSNGFSDFFVKVLILTFNDRKESRKSLVIRIRIDVGSQ